MDVISLSARLVLLGALALSGAAKVVDRSGTRRAAADLGVPATLAGPVAVVLPVVEVALAVGLALGPTAVASAWLAVALMAVFSVTIAANLARGSRPDCGCFGPLTQGTIGWATLARNAVLAAAGVVVAVRADGHVVAAARALDPIEAVAVAAGIAVLVVVAVRSSVTHLTGGPPREDRPPPLEAGDPAPPFTLDDLEGRAVGLDDLLARGRPLLLVFASPTCGACVELLPRLASWQVERRDRVTIAVIAVGPADMARESVQPVGLSDVLLDPDGASPDAYRLQASPGAALIDGDGRLVAPVGHGDTGVFELLLDGLGLGAVVRPLVEDFRTQAPAARGGEPDEPDDLGSGPAQAPRQPSHELDLDDAPRPEPQVVLIEHEGESVLVDRANGGVALLNPSAATVWRCLDGTGTLGEIATDISEVFGVDRDQVQADVVGATRLFGVLGLLDGVEPSRGHGRPDPPGPADRASTPRIDDPDAAGDAPADRHPQPDLDERSRPAG